MRRLILVQLFYFRRAFQLLGIFAETLWTELWDLLRPFFQLSKIHNDEEFVALRASFIHIYWKLHGCIWLYIAI